MNNTTALLQELLQQPEYWEMPGVALARLVGCSPALVSRVKSWMPKPSEHEMHTYERALLKMMSEAQNLKNLAAATHSTGLLEHAIRFIGKDELYKLIAKIDEEEQFRSLSPAEVVAQRQGGVHKVDDRVQLGGPAS